MSFSVFSPKELVRFSQVILVVWLCALFSHNAHAEIVSQIEADVECHLCQNTLDKVGYISGKIPFSQRVLRVSICQTKCSLVFKQASLLPDSRAPPKP